MIGEQDQSSPDDASKSSTTSPGSFRCEFEYSTIGSAKGIDSCAKQVMEIVCHGSLVAGTIGELEDLRKSVVFCPHVIFDLADVSYVDSDGLDCLIRLRLWAFLEGINFELVELAPRLLQLT